MTKRCDNCKYFEEIVFLFESENTGYGVWDGWCKYKECETRNLFYACESFEPNKEYLKQFKQLHPNEEILEVYGVLR